MYVVAMRTKGEQKGSGGQRTLVSSSSSPEEEEIEEALGLPAVAKGEGGLVSALLVPHALGLVAAVEPLVQLLLVRIAAALLREPAVGPLELLHGLQGRVPLGLVPVARMGTPNSIWLW